MAYVEFTTSLHRSSKRDYLARAADPEKPKNAEVAIQYGADYWDGDRRYGYGGYRYDGRWRSVAESLVKYYGLGPGARILDVGCGKGYLLYEFTQVLPQCEVAGIDISAYAIENAKPEIKDKLHVANATKLPFPDRSFDFVFSNTTLHNLYNYELDAALREIERVGRGPKHVIVESYRNELEKVNLLAWQLTCRSFYTPKEWEWFMQRSGYTGDFSCIYFE